MEEPEELPWLLELPWWLLELPWLLLEPLNWLEPLVAALAELLDAWTRACCTDRAMEGRRAAIIWATRRSVLMEEAADREPEEEEEMAAEASSDCWLNWLLED